MVSGKITALHVLAKEIKPEEKTESGLIFKPVAVMQKSNFCGEVVMVGKGTLDVEMEIQVGDKILFSPHAFRKFIHPLDGQEYLEVHQKDVMLIY